jgi:FtsP/CotA-like multicopper oxidase with cupredoxin domain
VKPLALLAFITACSAPGQIQPLPSRPDAAPRAAPAVPVGQPPDWDRGLRPAEAVNLSQVRGIVQVRLEAAPIDLELVPGVKTRVWAYNGSVPGPLIRARVGERVIVTFVNHLPEDSTVHWHGIRLPAEMDGVPGHSQAPVPPGGEFRYEFVVPDAGLFWYHPHVQSAKQVGDGLYGPLLVEDPGEPAGLGDEVVMVLSDISLDDNGQLAPSDAGGGIGSLFGREGEHVLVNGQLNPTLLARPGRRQRWRLVNAARSRYFQLALEGHTFTRLGGDGGFLEAPLASDRLVLTPGQRADVLVTPQGSAGSERAVRWVPYDRGYGSTYMRPEVTMFTIRFAEPGAVTNAPLPAHLRTITALDPAGAVVQELHLTSNVIDGQLVMGINGKPSGEAPPLYARLGQTQVWNVTNDIDFAHPFHVHGFFFQVLSSGDVHGPLPPAPIEWRDTADVPAKGKMSLAIRFDDRPGMWMFHCHILDHADAGMMGEVMLQP